MSPSLACIALVVRDYDEAIAWYRNTLGFDLIEPRPTHTEAPLPNLPFPDTPSASGHTLYSYRAPIAREPPHSPPRIWSLNCSFIPFIPHRGAGTCP